MEIFFCDFFLSLQAMGCLRCTISCFAFLCFALLMCILLSMKHTFFLVSFFCGTTL